MLAYNGIKINKLTLPQYPTTRTPKNALFVGRLIKDKGIDILVESIKLLKERGIDIHLTIVGEGPLRNYLERYVADNNLSNFILLAGYEHNVSKYYSKVDFQIIPSVFHEPFCLVSIEGRMHGLPAIYTNRGGLIETREHELNGIVINDISPQTIADATTDLINNIEIFEKMRRNCLKNLKNFSIEKMVDVYITEYLKEFGIR